MNQKQVDCKGCGEPIIWLDTVNAKRMPIDPEPNSTGKVIIQGDVAVVLKKNQEYSGPRYTSHWETCSKADDFRKKKGGQS